MVELRRQSVALGRWRRVVLFVCILLSLVVLAQMLLVQFRSEGLALFGGHRTAVTSRRALRLIGGVANNGSTSEVRMKQDLMSIGLLVAARAGFEKSVHQVPFLKECLPSLLETIEPRKRDSKFVYSIYFGYDVDDPIYDNSINMRHLRNAFDKRVRGYNLSLKVFRYNGTRGKPVWAWNRLARAAYRDDADYLYQVNDDVRFVTKNWTMRFVEALGSNRRFPGLGVAGPCDRGNLQKLLLTQSFVSRVHLDIFKHFYPPLFRNWFSDDWITQVYHPNHLFKFSDVFVNNTLVQSTRYDIDYGGEKVLSTLVSDGRAAIEEFLQTNSA